MGPQSNPEIATHLSRAPVWRRRLGSLSHKTGPGFTVFPVPVTHPEAVEPLAEGHRSCRRTWNQKSNLFLYIYGKLSTWGR